jgi:cytochrome P450
MSGFLPAPPSTIEEVLRFRSPLQWMPRATTRNVELHGRVIPAGKLALPMIGSANRDAGRFADAGRFDVSRDPSPHLLAWGRPYPWAAGKR